MSEQFHEWVHNLPWYERLYYELFEPEKIRCSNIPININYLNLFVFIFIIVTVVFVFMWWYEKRKMESTHLDTNSLEQPESEK